MSEYQYDEFVAFNGPISDEGLGYAEGCSSRADVSRFRWRNVYNFGDFHGKVETEEGSKSGRSETRTRGRSP